MRLLLMENNYRYAAEQILLMMFPEEKPEYTDSPDKEKSAVLRLHRGGAFTTATCGLYLDGVRFSGQARVKTSAITDGLTRERLEQRLLKLSFYRAALRSGREKPVWGALTGIRPGKLMTRYLEAGLTGAQAVSEFCREYDADKSRASLCLDTALIGQSVSRSLMPGDICLYVGIPFCPTRCAYCSFVSNSVEKSMKLVAPFLDSLIREIRITGGVVRQLGLRPVSLYIGGGTPTTLTPEQLEAMCSALEESFDLSHLREYTVEAGRPDTITPEKLAVLKRRGVGRVSVNPQSMSDEVLRAIGRRHTAEDVLRAVEAVRQTGAMAVNMDLIAGLPNDTARGFSHTLDTAISLAAENITVHTLSLKKGSRIMLEGTLLPDAAAVGGMLDNARLRLKGAGYSPYYLYRQKFMSGGFENVGWCVKGHESLYNVCIMEELCSIISMGGGASTKLVSPEGRIQRVFNPKYPQEYIDGNEKIQAGKNRIKEFYSGFQAKRD